MPLPFPALVELSKSDPDKYRAEIRRMKEEEPARLDEFVEWFQKDLEKATKPRRHASILALVLGATTTRQAPR